MGEFSKLGVGVPFYYQWIYKVRKFCAPKANGVDPYFGRVLPRGQSPFRSNNGQLKVKKSKLQTLYGKKVIHAELGGAEAGLLFENGINLNIYNKYEIAGIDIDDVQRLIGNSVSNIEESPEYWN